jgi:vacuolar-type H+-ATPase subunit F/Vma7
MSAPAYIGDEVSAAGYRLAGAHVCVPVEGAATAAFDEACARSALVLVSATVAARIDPVMLRSALMALAPLVLIVPDMQGEVALPDLAARLRAQLGMES